MFFDHRALTSAVKPPRLWRRYADDTFVILQQSHREEFLQHINSVDPSIHFTTEEAKQDGYMPFLDTSVTPQDDETLTTSVYRKSTHTDLYLQWDSHHNLACKYSVINTLTHRAKAVCSNSKLHEEELKHQHEVLHQCKYPKWAISKVLKQEHRREQETEESKAETPARHRRNITLWYLIPKAYVKATRPSVVNMESRYTSRVRTL